jgi:hypothetical protein
MHVRRRFGSEGRQYPVAVMLAAKAEDRIR